MKKYAIKGAVAAFYYLAMADSNVTQEELEKFDEIGNTIDPEHFAQYREELIASCESQKDRMIDEEDYADVILEALDRSLEPAEDEAGVASRMLIWNMLVISMADEDYSQSERRLIKHLVRITETEKSVFLEMEQLINAYFAVQRERASLADSERPYKEMAPVMEQLNKREQELARIAQDLIADEEMLESIKAVEYEPDFVDKIGKGIAGAAAPVISDVGKAVGGFFENTFSKISFGKKKNDQAKEEE